MKVALFFACTEVGIQLPCRGFVGFFENRITVKRGKETRKAPCSAELDKITCEILIGSKLINMKARVNSMEAIAFA